MARTLQLKWSDEDEWRSVRELHDFETEVEVMRIAKQKQAEVDLRYPGHTFSAEFRIIDTAIRSRASQLNV